MIKKVCDSLAKSTVSDYEVIDVRTRSVQLFYVLNKLETNRYTDNHDLIVAVYVDHEDHRGSSSFKVLASDDEESINNKINEAIEVAQKIDNPPFELYDGDPCVYTKIGTDGQGLDVLATKVMDAIVKADHFDNVWINSTEIFITTKDTHFINSKGIDESFTKTTVEIELIPTSKNKNGEEFELYFDKTYIDPDLDEIKSDIEAVLEKAIDRADAVIYDPQKMHPQMVAIDGDMAEVILGSIINDINYMNVLMQNNHYKLNDKITPYDLSVTLNADIDKASNVRPFDDNGVVLSSKEIIKNGDVIDNWGSLIYGQYLKVDKPSGSYSTYVTRVDEKQRIEKPNVPYMELISFSSPQFDASTGYFGGEVRLARYHDEDGNIVPVTGLSLSGDLYQAIQTANYSNEDVTTARGIRPEVIYFDRFKLH